MFGRSVTNAAMIAAATAARNAVPKRGTKPVVRQIMKKVAQAMNPSPVPTMSDYALWLLGAALMLFGMRRLKA